MAMNDAVSAADTHAPDGGLASVESALTTRYRDVAEQWCGVPPAEMVSARYSRLGAELAAEREARRRAIVTPDDWQRERERFRADYQRALGPDHVPGPVETLERGVVETPHATVRKVLFAAFENDWVTANIYIPHELDAPAPAIIHACGHSAAGKHAPGYATRGLTLARAGYVALTFDLVGMGERQVHGPAGVQYPASAQHNILGNPMTLAGWTLGWLMVQETMAAVSLLQSLEQVDGERIGITGGSGGGWLSVHAAALDERIKVVVPAAAVRSYRHRLQTADAEQNLFDMQRRGLDFPDLLSLLICPRPTLIVANHHDIWPLQTTAYAHDEAHRFYDMLGQGDRLEMRAWDRGHAYKPDQFAEAIAWFDRWLRYDGEPVPTPAVPELTDVPEPAALQVTRTGNLYDEGVPGPRAVFWPMARRTLPARADVAGFVQAAAKRTPVTPPIAWTELSRSDISPWAMVRTLCFSPEPGILLPAEVLVPHEPATLRIMLDESDRREDLDWQMRAVGQGDLVIRPDLRGWGETTPAPDWSDLESWAQRFYSGHRRALHGLARLIGRDLPLDRVRDLRALLHVAAEIAGNLPIHLHARRGAALPALLLALVEQGIGRLTLERPLHAFADVTERDLPVQCGDGYIHGLFQWGLDIPELLAAVPAELTIHEPLDAWMQPVTEAQTATTAPKSHADSDATGPAPEPRQ